MSDEEIMKLINEQLDEIIERLREIEDNLHKHREETEL